MIVDMVKQAWARFTAPMRPRQPLKNWSQDLLAPHEKYEIAEKNREIKQITQRLERELTLIARDHRRN
jgi:hypothetical protein